MKNPFYYWSNDGNFGGQSWRVFDKQKLINWILFGLIGILFVITLASCNKYVYNRQKIGILELTNNSISTVEEVFVNNISYGLLTPGKVTKIKLVPGVYTWQLRGLGGVGGCTPTTGTIVAGYTQAFNCSVK
jgi:hypothetical protein